MTNEHFKQIEPLWLFGKPDPYGEADAANMEHCAEFVQMRCDGDITVAQARTLRDWLNAALPDEPKPQARDAEHCDFPDCEQHWTHVVAQARALLEPLADCDPAIRQWLKTPDLPRLPELTAPPHPGPSIEKAFARSPRKITATVLPAICGKPMPDGKGAGQCINVPGHEGECDDMPF